MQTHVMVDRCDRDNGPPHLQFCALDETGFAHIPYFYAIGFCHYQRRSSSRRKGRNMDGVDDRGRRKRLPVSVYVVEGVY